MAKIRDCVECSFQYSMWEDYKGTAQLSKAGRRFTKRMLRITKKFHSRIQMHDYNYDFARYRRVNDSYTKTLIHNGGK